MGSDEIRFLGKSVTACSVFEMDDRDFSEGHFIVVSGMFIAITLFESGYNVIEDLVSELVFELKLLLYFLRVLIRGGIFVLHL